MGKRFEDLVYDRYLKQDTTHRVAQGRGLSHKQINGESNTGVLWKEMEIVDVGHTYTQDDVKKFVSGGFYKQVTI